MNVKVEDVNLVVQRKERGKAMTLISRGNLQTVTQTKSRITEGMVEIDRLKRRYKNQ